MGGANIKMKLYLKGVILGIACSVLLIVTLWSENSTVSFYHYEADISAAVIPPITHGQYGGPTVTRERNLTEAFKNSPIASYLKKVPFTRIILIGAGPTTLGALHRLYDIGVLDFTSQIQVIVFEKDSSLMAHTEMKDKEGFIWNSMGGHRIFSHYNYFTEALKRVARSEYILSEKYQGSYVLMKGRDGKHRFIPSPLQDNLHYMDKIQKDAIIKGLEKAQSNKTGEIRNYDDWLVENFGVNLSNIFMRRYSKKMWAVDTKELSSDWAQNTGEHVPDIESVKTNIAKSPLSDYTNTVSFNEPNKNKVGGAGVWEGVADKLPQGWFHYNSTVTGINIDKKQLTVVENQIEFSVHYDVLISTAPLDSLMKIVSSNNKAGSKVDQMKRSVSQLKHTCIHLIRLWVSGSPPDSLQGKYRIQIPDSIVNTPFHRVTILPSVVNSNGTNHWSLLLEVTEPPSNKENGYNGNQWTQDTLVQDAIRSVTRCGLIDSTSRIVTQYYHKLDHGYPIPSVDRDRILGEVQPWLESHSIYSRGLYGGWKYEVGNQDHSFMQGVEIVDWLLLGVPEETYPNPYRVNTMKASNRQSFDGVNRVMDYEFVIARYEENLEWMVPFAKYTHIYNKGNDKVKPDFRFNSWSTLPNVGKEGHTYLYHIVNNYNTLADITVFMQGQLRKGERRRCFADDPFQYIIEARRKGIGYGAYQYYSRWHWRRDVEEERCIKNSMNNDNGGKYFDKIFGFHHPKTIISSYYGCFSVSKERILRRPRELYRRLMQSLDYCIDPAEGYFIEKYWVALFSLFKKH